MLCVLTRWDFNFYIRSSPLRDPMQRKVGWRLDQISWTVSQLVLWAQSTIKYCTRAEIKLHSIAKLFITQVIIPQVFFKNHNTNSIHNFGMKTDKNKTCFWAYLFSAGTQQGKLHPAGWPILFCGPALATVNTGKNWERFCTKWETSVLGLKTRSLWSEWEWRWGGSWWNEVRSVVMEWGEVGHDGMRWGGSWSNEVRWDGSWWNEGVNYVNDCASWSANMSDITFFLFLSKLSSVNL